MLNEARVIKAIVQNKDIAPALHTANIDTFFDSHEDVWRFVKEYYYKNREVAPVGVLKENFPEFELDHEVDGSVRHYVDQLRDEYTTSALNRLARGLAKNVGEVSNSDIIQKLQSFVSDLSKTNGGIKDLDLTDQKKTVEHYTELNRRMEENGGVLGIRSGFDSIDSSYPTGFAPGQYIMILSRTNQGKRLRVDEPIPTPDGWTTMGELTPGARVFGSDGRPCSVTQVSEIDPNPDAYKIVFSDGTEMEADLEHQWLTTTHLERRRREAPKVRTTKEILATLRHGKRPNHAIPMVQPVELEEKDLSMDPYVFGLWLGDGSKREPLITMHYKDWAEYEKEFIRLGVKYHLVASQAKGNTVVVHLENMSGVIRELNVKNNKHIPMRYLRGSIAQRRELLQGLMDSDGTSTPGSSTLELSFCNERLAEDAAELIRSLGHRVNCRESDAKLYGRKIGSRWRMSFVSRECPFKLSRKVAKWIPAREARSKYKVIRDVVPVTPTPMRCITVDSPDHTYVAGKNWSVTHNSWFALDLGLNAWTQQKRILVISLEMSPHQVQDRAYTLMSQGQFKMSDLSRAQIDLRALKTWSEANLNGGDNSLMVSSSDGMGDFNPSQLQAKIDQYCPDLVVVDYLQLMSDNRGSNGETERIRNVSKELKSLAMSNQIPIIAVAAASSNDTKEYNKPPEIYEVAGSRQSAYDADLVLALFSNKRPDGTQLTEVCARKSRHGPLFDFQIIMDIEGGTLKETWDVAGDDII